MTNRDVHNDVRVPYDGDDFEVIIAVILMLALSAPPALVFCCVLLARS
jgi:hypothetical protein